MKTRRSFKPWAISNVLLGALTLAALGQSGRATEETVFVADANASVWPGSQGEVSVATDPMNPMHVVAATMSFTGSQFPVLSMASVDGGATWRQAPVPTISGASLHADPMVTFGLDGVVHLVYIPVAPGNRPMGIYVTRSTDGLQWETPIAISQALGQDDKDAIAVDRSPESPHFGNIYLAWKWPRGGVFVSRSIDDGRTFSPPTRISELSISGLDIATDINGVVYLAANGGPVGRYGIQVFRSMDGGVSFEAPRLVVPRALDGYTTAPSVCRRMSIVHASIASDTSAGPERGSVYLTWNDHPDGTRPCSDACSSHSSCTIDVFASISRDHGETWTSPRPVHEDDLGNSDQFHHWARVDPIDGTLYVAYKDTRDDPARMSTHVYLSRSVDGGRSFKPSIRLSSANGSAASPSAVGFQYGDYQGLAVAGGRAYAAWADFRTSSSEIYVGRYVVENMSR